jgi:hypothetical protein
VYSSPVVGLHNKWELWVNRSNTIIVINLRGTTGDLDSWLENFYCAMVPATGALRLSNNHTFYYQFAADPKAAVHVGWAVGVGSIADGVTEKIKAYYAKGAKQLLVEGHSQGGALAFLLTSYLHYEMVGGRLPGDLVIKTYCSAAPKPGNTYYAYDFDYITRGGWAFTVVSAVDWVPETPLSAQTLQDLNKVNPFSNVNSVLRKQKLMVRLYLGHVYRQMKRGLAKVNRRFEKRFGRGVYKQVKKYMPELAEPKYAGTFSYMRAGNPIVLEPDADYYKNFPDTGKNIFRNHYFEPYDYLVRRAYK